jgi:hypothetical protein
MPSDPQSPPGVNWVGVFLVETRVVWIHIRDRTT